MLQYLEQDSSVASLVKDPIDGRAALNNCVPVWTKRGKVPALDVVACSKNDKNSFVITVATGLVGISGV